MKGVALSLNPDLTVVDVTHEVPPQDVLAGALALEAAAPHFPPGTIHVVVVDPGVGSERRGLAVASGSALFVGPDNGVLSLAWKLGGEPRAVALEEKKFFRELVSATFHGRDVFAPVAAHLSIGVELSELGPTVPDPVTLELPRPVAEPGGSLVGEVIAVDRFGNLITNLRREDVTAAFGGRARGPLVRIAGRSLGAPVRTYADLAPNGVGSLYGSADRLEIASRGGSAAVALSAARGARRELA